MMRRSIQIAMGLTVALLLGRSAAAQAPSAQPCQLQGCTTVCQGGCSTASFPIQHTAFGLGAELGRFDLTMTDYVGSCDNGLALPCTRPGNVPPLRFWAYDGFRTGNNGCFSYAGKSWLVNCKYDQSGCLDLGEDGHWTLSQANWAAGCFQLGVDGCISSQRPVPPDLSTRTVVELSFADTSSGEETVDHDAWYIVAAVEFDGSFDFDRIQGGDTAGGLGPADLLAQSVPDVSFTGMTCPDNGAAIVFPENAVDGDYYDVTVDVSTTTPPFFTERGRDDSDSPLIVGLQVVFQRSLAAPRSSVRRWLPARDPADPADQIAGLIPWGGSASATVALPKVACGARHWLATRIVYKDATVNFQTGPGPDATGPRLVTPTGKSCGPVEEVGAGCR